MSERDRRIEDDREFPRVRGNEKKASFIPHFARGAVREGGTAGSIVGCGEWRRETRNMAKYIHLKVVESSPLTPSPDFGQCLFTCGEAIGAGQQVVFGMGPA